MIDQVGKEGCCAHRKGNAVGADPLERGLRIPYVLHDDRRPDHDRDDHAENEPQLMSQRRCGQNGIGRSQLKMIDARQHVPEQGAPGVHHAFGFARGARRVEQLDDVIRCCPARPEYFGGTCR